MVEPRCCPYCHLVFNPSKSQPGQTVCSDGNCQRQRRLSYRRNKIATDPNYLEACRQSARQWRKQHPDYWKQYREANPASAESNREQQKLRDRKQALQNLANNTSASGLKLCPAKVWLIGPELHDLANNTSAPAKVWILEAVPPLSQAARHLANNTPLAP